VIIGILGILKAGGAYVPIDPEYPEQRISFIIKDLACRILVTQDKFMGSRMDGVLKINLNSPRSYHKIKSDIANINNPSDLAYIMYSIGTTEIPKGSTIPQMGVVRLVRNTNYIEFTSNDKILMAGAIVFDATTFEIWGALLNGAVLYIVEKETILNPKELNEELVKGEISIMLLTSSLFTQIAESGTALFSRLKYLLVGGDVLSVQHINKVRQDNPELKIINVYGPAENSCISTFLRIQRDFESNIPIGIPISNSTAYIFDKNLNYQPVGVIGELYVGGDGLSKGYLNREELNRTSFIDNPNNPGERLYKTGDRARLTAEGNIELLGRIDNQIKIRGFSIEVGEIESVISELDGVIETVIKPVKVGEGDYWLVAFLNVTETFIMDPGEINRRIKTKLPAYMVPSVFKLMNGFPININGKVDKQSLIIDIEEFNSEESEINTTLTTSEKIIHEIWCNVLKISEISVTDNFFDVGGNSLLAISVFSKIEAAFNVDLGLRIFFDSPRIKDLAETIDILKKIEAEQKSVKKTKVEGVRIINGEI
jgi:tyrocidine synthetase-3